MAAKNKERGESKAYNDFKDDGFIEGHVQFYVLGYMEEGARPQNQEEGKSGEPELEFLQDYDCAESVSESRKPATNSQERDGAFPSPKTAADLCTDTQNAFFTQTQSLNPFFMENNTPKPEKLAEADADS